MSIPISSLGAPAAVDALGLGQTAESGHGFKNVLESAIQSVEASRRGADTQIQDFLSGANQELHTTIIAEQTAELQFEMFLQARNKVVSAYEEIMRMQL
jgi:flagellar hook-basal body complex protein FliE